MPGAFRAVALVGVDLDVDYGGRGGHGLEQWMVVGLMM